MYTAAALATLSLLAAVRGQQVGTNTAETHPALTVSQCTADGTCTPQQKSIVLDANWRWLHATTGYTNCYTGNSWNATICPDPTSCTANCALDGADYSGTYGISTSGDALTLKFVTKSQGTNVGSRVYLLDDDKTYKIFKLLNQEFTFDVDMSNLPCGINGALYFSQMDADGGMAKYSTNKAGAKYGTGYCDAQCPHDLKFINGEANVLDWGGSSNDANSGKGRYGTCCPEMDIWEANKEATAYTPHPCSILGPSRCSGAACGDGAGRYSGTCDKDGCDFNSWRMGDKTFTGNGLTVDLNKKVTVVTQFITNDGTASGTLSEIRRFYVQNGVTYANSVSKIAGIDGNAVNDNFCKQQKTVFGDTNDFATKGGLAQMSKSFASGMVLVMSIWDDHEANLLWLDSSYPTDGDVTKPGINRGPCATTSGVPAELEASVPNSSVTFSNIKIGPIGSTFKAPGGSTGGTTTVRPVTSSAAVTSSARPATSSAATGGGTVAKWAQCGGNGYTGATACVAGSTCTKVNDWYSQCL